MPPVLYIAFFELVCSGACKLRARNVWSRIDERHYILQLISETVSAARLVKSCARQHATRQCLIGQPTIEDCIHRGVWRMDFYGFKYFIPMRDDALEGFIDLVQLAVALYDGASVFACFALTEQEDNLMRCARLKLYDYLERGARV